jgi:putative membrane protein
MKRALAASATLLAAIAAVSFGQAQRNTTQTPTAGARTAGSQAQAGGSAQDMKMEEQHFIQEVASDNMFEQRLGQMVEQKAQDPQIKKLAQKLAQDHQKAEQQLQPIAQQMGITLSQELNPVHQAMLQEMQKKQGQQLERAFAFHTVGEHQTDILMFQYVAQHAPDQQVKQYAQEQIPTLREHMMLAQQCSEQFVPEARTAGEHMRGNSSGSSIGTSGASDRSTSGSRSSGTSGSSSGTSGRTPGGASGGSTTPGGASGGASR